MLAAGLIELHSPHDQGMKVAEDGRQRRLSTFVIPIFRLRTSVTARIAAAEQHRWKEISSP